MKFYSVCQKDLIGVHLYAVSSSYHDALSCQSQAVVGPLVEMPLLDRQVGCGNVAKDSDLQQCRETMSLYCKLFAISSLCSTELSWKPLPPVLIPWISLVTKANLIACLLHALTINLEICLPLT